MSLVGIPEEEQLAVCRTVAAVLHLGNVGFVEGPEDSSRLAPGGAAEGHLRAAAALLGVRGEGLLRALTTRTRHTTDGAPRLCAGLPAALACSPSPQTLCPVRI
jgi:myosin heavy subunit